MKHRHNWQLAEHFNGHLIDVSDKVKSYRPPTAKWLCHCGAQKTVEVSDLFTEDRADSEDVSNAP